MPRPPLSGSSSKCDEPRLTAEPKLEAESSVLVYVILIDRG